MSEVDTSGTIQLKNGTEGERRWTNDLFFKKIGESVPIKSSDHQFNSQCIPAQPLAVSEHFELIFVAHSKGFCVARTKDVIDSAKEFKEQGSAMSIHEMSILDISMDKVHILALSSDSSNLAACVAGDIHIFSVISLLDKVQRPCDTCSLTGSCSVKAIHWNTKLGASFIVLSNHGKLYHGVVKEPLFNVMENVDAVEWSIGGKYVSVARKNVVTILSSKFKEKFSLSLSFDSWIDDSDVNCTVKVDSIRWIRRDCIILGCTKLSSDGEEKDYMLQVITSKNGNFIDVFSERVVLFFSELFFGLTDDVLPLGGGPNLFMSYIEECQLVITANRRYATDPHIVLLSWAEFVDSNDAAVIEIQRDTLLPKIELQENGDDNMILGLCIDKSSISGRISVKIGVEDWQEILPYCVMMCLTIEGKLLLFHVGSIKGSPDACQLFTDDGEDIPSSSDDQSLDDVVPGFNPLGRRSTELSALNKISDTSTVKMSPVPMLVSDQKPHKETDVLNKESNSFLYSQTGTSGKHNSGSAISGCSALKTSQDQSSTVVVDFNKEAQNFVGVEFRHDSSLKSSVPDLSSSVVGDSSNITRKTHGFESRHDFSLGKFEHDMCSPSSNKHVQTGVEYSTEVIAMTTSERGSSNQSLLSGNHIFTTDSGGISSGSFSNYNQINMNKNFGACVSTEQPALHESCKYGLNSVHSIAKPILPIAEPKKSAGSAKIEPLPSIYGLQSSSSDCSTSGKSSNFQSQAVKEVSRSPLSEMINPNSKKSMQSGNIKDAIKNLDRLLRCIEEPGGFKDSCSALLKGPVAALERDIASLSEKCSVRRNVIGERVCDVQYLLDATVEVISGKVYMEGILKQATDNQYWDFLNPQKLSFELEQKRRHILEMNEDLNNQLIELERHFNTLDLHNFGAKDRPIISQEVFQSKLGRPRQIQSLHTLHNTMTSQLSAAEQLSVCLSKQMDALSIQSPVKQSQFKKELFGTIGIPYDGDTHSSQEVKKSGIAISSKMLSPSSPAAMNFQSKRNQSSILKSDEPETARRKRYLLAPRWASFEPPKIIVKRMLLHREEESRSKSSLADKSASRPYVPLQSIPSHLDHKTKPLTFSEASKNIDLHNLKSSQFPETLSSFRSTYAYADDPPEVNLSSNPQMTVSPLPINHKSTNETHALPLEKVVPIPPDTKTLKNPLSFAPVPVVTPVPLRPEVENSVVRNDFKVDLNSCFELSEPELLSPTPPSQTSPAFSFAISNNIEKEPKAAECTEVEFSEIQGEVEMEEEAPEVQGLNLGSLGGFGVSSTNVAKSNPFGSPISNKNGAPFQMSVPDGQFLRPAAFSAQSSVSNFVAPAPSTGFGHTIQVGPGQQALGSVLGGFGQSRQISGPSFGGGISSFTGGFTGAGSTGGGFGGFSGSSQSAGGFAGVGSSGGGFGGVAAGGAFSGGGFGSGNQSGGGFGGLGSTGGGFGGFKGVPSAAAAPAPGGGFGGSQGIGGFSALGGASASAGSPSPSQLFTQMRK